MPPAASSSLMDDAAGGLVPFVTGLAGAQLEALFGHSFCVAAILRSLQPLARQIVLRLLWSTGAASEALVHSWVRPGGQGKLESALRQLEALRLLGKAPRGGQASWVLHPGFQARLRHSICHGLLEAEQASAAPPPAAAAVPSPAELSAYARGQWEALLLFLVSGGGEPPAAHAALGVAPVEVPRLLAGAGLMMKDEYTLAQRITEAGFQFLLADLYAQLWGIIRQYLADLQATAAAASGGGGGADLATAVNFLLRLGLQGGAPMAFASLPPAERAIAAHMAQLGLLMPAAAGSDTWLHPTRLAAVLAGGGRRGAGAEAAAAASEDGFAIVESNFRVYAYTTSAVQVAILRVFVRCDCLLPNLFVGTITRESATAALALGIAADQIVAFLRQHAHPRVAAKPPIVPPVVADQIRLWGQELQRMRLQRATLYDKFESPELYASAVQRAQALGALLTKSDEKKSLVVDAAHHEAMRQHLRETKQQLGLK